MTCLLMHMSGKVAGASRDITLWVVHRPIFKEPRLLSSRVSLATLRGGEEINFVTHLIFFIIIIGTVLCLSCLPV